MEVTDLCTEEIMNQLGFETVIVDKHYYYPAINYVVYDSNETINEYTIQDIIDAYENYDGKVFPFPPLPVCPEITMGNLGISEYSNDWPDEIGGVTVNDGQEPYTLLISNSNVILPGAWSLQTYTSKGSTYWFITGEEGD